MNHFAHDKQDKTESENRNNAPLAFNEGGEAWRRFKAKAKALTRRNHFSPDDAAEMEARALEELLSSSERLSASTVKSREGYLQRAIDHALGHAATKVADDRSVWQTCRQSLDAPVGAEGEALTFADLVTENGGLGHSAKTLGIPRPVRIRWEVNRRRRDDHAKRLLLKRIAEDLAETTEGADNEPLPTPDAERADTADTRNEHDRAVAEIGLADDPDEAEAQTAFRSPSMGFGDCAASLFEFVLRVDVAVILQDLEPRDRAWCQLVLNGWDAAAAYRSLKISRTRFYASVLPRLREKFASLADAVKDTRDDF